MTEPTREELLRQKAEMQRQMAELEQRLAAEAGAGDDSAIAQGPSAVAAAGASVAVGGSVFGDIYTGDLPRNDAEALAIYRRVYAASCRNLPLRGIDVGSSDAAGKGKKLGLDHVYIELNTTAQVSKKALEAGYQGDDDSILWLSRQSGPAIEDIGMRQASDERSESVPLPVLLAARFSRAFVLLGDPGSGKSTFLNHLGLCLAMHALKPDDGWLRRLKSWPEAEGDLLPVAVTLRDYARTVPADKGKATTRQLWDFIVARLRAQNLEFAAEPLREALEQGRAIVLLDGLDEIPTKRQRRHVRDAVALFANRYKRSRFLITCRTLSYQDPEWQLQDIPAYELAPFSEAQIDGFVEAWYAELQRLGSIKAGQAATLTMRLKEAVRRPDLRRLAPNPLLLTVMALVHTHKGRLPDARALLYADTVDILLWRWDEIRFGDEEEAPPMRQLLLDARRTDVDLKKVLWRLAFEAHTGSDGDDDALADISEWQLQRALAGLHPDESKDWATALIGAMKLRAGLLLERAPEVYTFPHRTFQEFLAGCHLAAQGDFTKQASKLVKEGAFWRQVILLAVGRLTAQGDSDKPLALTAELCPVHPAESELGWRKVWLAGEVLAEMGLNRVGDSALGRDMLERVQKRLAALLAAGALTPVERAAAGDILAQLGDPRFRADAFSLPDEPLLGFVEIPTGEFIMGERGEQHTVRLPAFYIARYPVTVAQFRTFVETSNFQPGDPDCLRDPDTRPVRWINWHEALAYCDWLTEMLQNWPETPALITEHLVAGWRFTLPSEAQWEKAARGIDGREYPWGPKPDPEKANYGDTGIGTTSAVGCFPSGASSYGVEELSGNAWEWCLSKYAGYPYADDDRNVIDTTRARRVLRGGAFSDSGYDVRCALRLADDPHLRDGLLGFRVVFSPGEGGQAD